jgi:ATP-binding cassette, subfamily G (WHITE), member 2, SNQ2
MVLVLGKPGSGCSTFLRAITNQRASFAEVTGAVHYGGIPSDETLKHYRAEIVYSEEDDIHFPLLTVRQTLFFALLNKVRRREWPIALEVMEVMGRVFGMSKVFDTIVGNGFIRGVSGGERKRVSIVETLATAASITAWDNSTRGLDASTAVEYVKSLRIITDTMKRTTFVTLYQAGEGIYNLMDKILLIDDGRMIYSGPANAAKAYFIDLGFECPPRQTTADFLTAVTDPVERRFRPGWELKAPKTAEELERAFKASNLYVQIMDEVTIFERELKESDSLDARNFKDSVAHQKSKTVSGKSNYTVSFVRQVAACSRREFWLLKGNLSAIYTKTLINLGVALVLGSLFYNTPDNTEGMFSRGGVLTISLLFNSWLQMVRPSILHG